MNCLNRWKRPITGLALAAIAVVTLSPAAEAGHRSRRYKGYAGYCPTPVVRHGYYAPRRVVYVRHSDAAPVLAGLVGGFILGTAVAHASAPAPDYYYWDAYCHERFATLELYCSHLHRHHHPKVVRVIEIGSGDCVDTYRWHDGDWRSWDGDRDWDRDRDWDGDRDRDRDWDDD